MRKIFPIVALTTIMIFCISSSVRAGKGAEEEKAKEQPIQEIFQTELVYPQEKGEVQLFLAPGFTNGYSQERFQIPLSIEYGITDAWQIELEWNSFVNIKPRIGENRSGTGDIELRTKYSFMDIADLNFHAAVGADVSLPTGSEKKGLGEGETQFEVFFILAKNFEKLKSSRLFTQAVVEVEDGGAELSWNPGLFIPSGQLCFSTEFSYGQEQVYLTPGLILNLPQTWEIGIGIPLGLNDDSDDYRILAVLTYEFNLFEEKEDQD